MNLQELKNKTPADLILEAEKLGIENPSTMRKQEILFAILKKLAEKNEKITGSGVLETLQDGFGFLRATESNYLPGPDDIYVSQVKLEDLAYEKEIRLKEKLGLQKIPRDILRFYKLAK